MKIDNNKNTHHGQAVYIYAFDLAYDMKRETITQLLGQPIQEYSISLDKRSPRQLFFYHCQMVTLAPQWQKLKGKTVPVDISVKIFNVGAISIQARVPFEIESMEDLYCYHELSFDEQSLEDIILQLAEKARQELEPYCLRPLSQLNQIEDYRVFCFDFLRDISEESVDCAEKWLIENRNHVAALLTQEQDGSQLSEQEAAESTELYITYYDSDLVVIDWDTALIIGQQESKDDIIHIMELANVQLVELAAYDRILDGSLEKAYRDLAHKRVRSSREVQRNLREIRIDLARLSDELSNITKFFGDWYLASVYRKVSTRFHLADWHGVIRDKLRILGDLYQMLHQDWINFWMMILEATIVLLFIIDLVLLFAKV